MRRVTVPALLIAGVLCAVIQRAVGVGYSFVLLPTAIAVLPAGQAVPCVLAVGTVLSVALLLSSGRRPRLDGATGGLVLTAPLGQLVALVGLGALRGATLQIAAACVLLAGCGSALAQRGLRSRTPGPATGAVAGLVIGAVGALTGVIGPFVALLLTLRVEAGGDDLRRQLWLCTAWLSSTALALSSMLDVGDPRGALVGLALAPALLVGALGGAPLAGRLKPRQHRLVVLLLASAGAATLLAGA